MKYQDRILFGTDDLVLFKGRNPKGSGNISVYPSDDPSVQTVDPTDAAAGDNGRTARCSTTPSICSTSRPTGWT